MPQKVCERGFCHGMAFQRKMQMPSPDKYLIHMLFGVIHGTYRSNNLLSTEKIINEPESHQFAHL